MTLKKDAKKLSSLDFAYFFYRAARKWSECALGDIKLSGGITSNKFVLLPSKKSGQYFVKSSMANGCILMGFFVFDHEFRLG